MVRRENAAEALGRRERQIMDTVYRLGEASVGEVLADLPDPPSYSSVRKMLSLLEEKGFVSHRRDGTKYIYRPTRSKQSASRFAVRHLLSTFFEGSATDAVNTILDISSQKLTNEDFQRLQRMIDDAQAEGQ